MCFPEIFRDLSLRSIRTIHGRVLDCSGSVGLIKITHPQFSLSLFLSLQQHAQPNQSRNFIVYHHCYLTNELFFFFPLSKHARAIATGTFTTASVRCSPSRKKKFLSVMSVHLIRFNLNRIPVENTSVRCTNSSTTRRLKARVFVSKTISLHIWRLTSQTLSFHNQYLNTKNVFFLKSYLSA